MMQVGHGGCLDVGRRGSVGSRAAGRAVYKCGKRSGRVKEV